jgi:predicted MFS family arabinose efflux permease
MVVVSIAYMDRINVALMIANGEFLRQFGLAGDRIAQGRLMTMFLLGYGVSAWFLTPLFEARWSVRAGLIVSLALWTLFTGAAAVAGSLLLFLAWRALLGVAEGPLFSLKTMYVKEHFVSEEVGKPNAVSSFGVSFGLAAGFPIISFLMAQVGWRGSLWSLAALNLFVGVPLVFFFIHSPAGAAKKTAGGGRQSLTLLREALRTPHLAPILLIEIATLSYLWGSSTWLPAYLKETHHFSIGQTSLFASLPFVMGLLSQLIGGHIIDKLPRRIAPIVFVLGGLATAISVTAAILATDAYVSATALILAGAFWGLQAPAIPTLVQHLSAPDAVGSTYGLINGVGNLVSALTPMLMGAAMTIHSTGDLGQGFWVVVGSQLVTAVCGVVLLRGLAGMGRSSLAPQM